MVGRKFDRYKYKWKYRVVAIAYVALLLAESGEFFVSHDYSTGQPNTNNKYVEKVDIPDHLPEKSGEGYSKHCRICYRDPNDNKEKCVEVALPLTS